jgi:dUTP pyrophosphatase
MRGFVPVTTISRKNYKLNEIENAFYTKERAYPDLKLPTRADNGSAGYDIYSPIDVVIYPHESVIIWTDLKAYMLPDEYLSIHIRSSMAIKNNITLLNVVGIIDSSYANNPDNEGNIAVGLLNNGSEPYFIKNGDRIAQGIFQKYLITVNDVVLSETRKGGVGSSGI